ncbi:hypothetical protein J4434_08185 [Candidatus Woesearchaeota archaeon]|nr:hypothetical protein [Candidatus Woesearchaeota archaeon]
MSDISDVVNDAIDISSQLDTLSRIAKIDNIDDETMQNYISRKIVLGALLGLGGLVLCSYSVYSLFSKVLNQEINIQDYFVDGTLGGIGLLIARGGVLELKEALHLKKESSEARLNKHTEEDFYWWNRMVSVQTTATEQTYGKWIHAIETLDEIDKYITFNEKDAAPMFLDHLKLRFHEQSSYDSIERVWDFDDNTLEGAQQLRGKIYEGTFLLERYGERKRIHYSFNKGVPETFAKLLEMDEKSEFALMFKHSIQKGIKNMGQQIPFIVEKVYYPHP